MVILQEVIFKVQQKKSNIYYHFKLYHLFLKTVHGTLKLQFELRPSVVYSAAIIQKTDTILYVLFNFTLFDLEIFLYSFKKISDFMTSF